jgi:hypothetical protein
MIQNCKYKKVPQLPSENDVSQYSDNDLFQLLDLNNPTDRELEAKLYSLIDKYHSIKNNVGQQMKEFYISIFKRFFETEEDEEQPHQHNWEEKKDEDAERHPLLKEGFETKEEGKTTTPDQITQSTQLITGETPTYTKNVDYTRGSLNPILKETIKRVVSIDSSFRNTDTYPYSTEFTFNLTETLHDVVSLKLYSVSIPYNWYTINQNFGSNFLYIKGIGNGINNGNFDYKVSINYGNYTADELVQRVDQSIQNSLIRDNPDISFGGTAAKYNPVNGRCTFTLDMKNTYNETCYYLHFPNWTDISTADTKRSIPELFGYKRETCYPFNVYSNPFVPNSDSSATGNIIINYVNNSLYVLTNDTNKFNVIIYQAKLVQNKITSYQSTDASLADIKITLFPDVVTEDGIKYSYSGTAIFNELNAQLNAHPQLVRNYDTSNNVIEQSMRAVNIGESNYVFEMSIRPNRRKSSNVPNQKMVVKFPDETNLGYVNTVWTGSSSLFDFPTNILEFQDVRGEYNSSTTSYFVNSSPYILLRCIAEGYYTKDSPYIANDYLGTAVDINDYKIDISNSPTSGYILSQYYTAIQNSFDSLKKSTGGQIIADVSNTNGPSYNTTLSFAIKKTITTDKFYIDTSGSFLKNFFNFNEHLRGGVLHEANSVYTNIDYDINASNNTFLIKPTTGNPETSALVGVSFSIEHNSYKLNELIDEINKGFNTYKTKNITLSNSSMTYEIKSGNKLNVRLNLKIESVLTNKDYLLYFFDGTSITRETIPSSKPEKELWYYVYSYITGFDASGTTGLGSTPYYYKWRLSEEEYVTTNSWGNNFGFKDPSNSLLVDSSGNPIPVTGNKSNKSNLLQLNETNKSFQLIPIYDPSGGVYNTRTDVDSTSNNVITFNLDLATGKKHTKEEVRDSINRAFSSNPITYGSYVDTTNSITLMRLNINKVFTAKDYSLVFYDVNTFTKCNYGSNSSAQITTADTSLGWKMGFRSDIAYNTTPENVNTDIQNGTTYYGKYPANAYTYDVNTNIATLTGDTSVNVNLYSNFFIILDDYTQNHLNDGLITTTIGDTDVPLPSYANKTSRKCIVANDKQGVSDTTSYTNFNRLTNAQLYSANQILNTKMTKYAKNVFSSGPFVQDIFGMIPMKTTGLNFGQTYSEFGGTLQIQERVYFGPVNISRMTVRLITDKGNVLDLNNQNWSFSLITEQLYNPNKG